MQGVQELHARKWCHSDLKLDNIRVQSGPGPLDFWVIIIFGGAQHIRDGERLMCVMRHAASEPLVSGAKQQQVPENSLFIKSTGCGVCTCSCHPPCVCQDLLCLFIPDARWIQHTKGSSFTLCLSVVHLGHHLIAGKAVNANCFNLSPEVTATWKGNTYLPGLQPKADLLMLDIWTLGCDLAWLTTASYPFDLPGEAAFADHSVHEEVKQASVVQQLWVRPCLCGWLTLAGKTRFVPPINLSMPCLQLA